MSLNNKRPLKSRLCCLFCANPRRIAIICLSACLILFGGCGSQQMRIQNLAKSDIDMVGDHHIEASNELLGLLLRKLYKRNPRELKKAQGATINTRLEQIFANPDALQFEELNNMESIDAILLGFDPEFKGDRVFALGVGLRGMLFRAYNEQKELFMLDSLDAQKLYNSARNIEILAWRLAHRRDQKGNLYLLTNSTSGPLNLSFERLFGKLIALQDMMAQITENRTRRTVNKIVHGIASAVFLPV